MQIKPNEIGNKASVYKKAMAVKKDVEDVARELKQVDDIEGIDFKNKLPGDVEVSDYSKSSFGGDLIETKNGTMKYDKETGEVTSLDVKQTTMSLWGRSNELKTETVKFEKKNEEGKDTYIEKNGIKTYKVSIDKETGTVDYNEFLLGIPIPSNLIKD